MKELVESYYFRTLNFDNVKELSSQGQENREIDPAAMRSHLKWMCQQILDGMVTGSKAQRWIGYIQGELRALGIFTIGQLRYHTREARPQDYVCGFAFADKLVALVTKAKPEWQKGKLNGVGGKVEEGETVLEAMVREFKEETGILTDEKDWGHFVTLHTKGSEIHFLRAQIGVDFNIKHLPEEPVRWYGINDVMMRQDKIPNLNWLIPMALNQTLLEPVEVYE